jgi:hypothetical protein
VDLLLWLDASPGRYFAVALASTVLTMTLAVLPAFRPLRRLVESAFGRAAFVAACTLTLFAFRWPLVAFPAAFNPDEAQFVAQALTFVHSPLPWKSFDGNNAGPLDTAIIALPAYFGISPSYVEARLVGLILIAGAIVCIYALIARVYGELAGRLAALFPLLFFATAVSRDFIHYTSETLSLFLLGLAAATLAWMARAPAARARFAAAGCGLALGALPFAKVQAVPIVVVLVVAALFLAERRRRNEPGLRASLAVSLLGGLLAVPLFLLCVVVASGVYGDFVTSYILMPLEYDRSIAPGAPSYTVRPNVGFGIFAGLGIVGSAVMLLAAFLFGRTRRHELGGNAGLWFVPLVALLTIFAADYAVARPHSDYIHYLLWFIMPIAALFGAAGGVLLNVVTRIAPAKHWLVPSLALATALYATVPPVNYRLHLGYPLYTSFAQDFEPESNPVLLMLERNVSRGDRISVWGWMPDFYVATGALLGTRDAITQFQIERSLYRTYYRDRYLADFALNRPHFFVDAVSPSMFNYHDVAHEGHESFPQLAAIVAANYREIGESYGVRLYERVR